MYGPVLVLHAFDLLRELFEASKWACCFFLQKSKVPRLAPGLQLFLPFPEELLQDELQRHVRVEELVEELFHAVVQRVPRLATADDDHDRFIARQIVRAQVIE